MKIRIGQVFRVPHAVEEPDGQFADYRRLTRGRHSKAAQMQKGIWGYRAVDAPDGRRRPALILLTNSLDAKGDFNPWLDIVEPDAGYALFHGDNRTPGRPPWEASGNKLFSEVLSTYDDPASRQLAPPIFLFEQIEVAGRKKGYRQFAGYGVPEGFSLQTQATKTGAYFTNLVVDLALFGLTAEDEDLDWSWIDDRRDAALRSSETLRRAPAAWKAWCKEGEPALERCRRRVLRSPIVKRGDQLASTSADLDLLRKIYEYYADNKHGFEGLAAFVVGRIVQSRFRRGWVTKRSGDGGVDFVCSFEIGSGFSSTPVVLLGQAKCVAPETAMSGRDLARVVARLRRGWVGAFVTTGYFSDRTQAELQEDEYPVILVNGLRVAQEIRKALSESGLSLEALLRKEDTWYSLHQRHVEPSRIVREPPQYEESNE